MYLNVFEGNLKVYLLKDVFNSNYQEKIAAVIDKSFIFDCSENFFDNITLNDEVCPEQYKDMKSFHHKNKFKGYVFNGFFDRSQQKNKDFVYKAGTVYNVRIRSVDEVLMYYFKNNLNKVRTEEMQALTFEYRKLPDNVITKIYSITPAVAKFEKGYWQHSGLTVNSLSEKIESNARAKLKKLFSQDLPQDIDFITNIKRLNSYPIVREYKRKGSTEHDNRKIKLLCDKFELEISPNENAQTLAKIIVGTGLLEMNARGFGYVNVKTL